MDDKRSCFRARTYRRYSRRHSRRLIDGKCCIEQCPFEDMKEDNMPIYTIEEYRVRASGVNEVAQTYLHHDLVFVGLFETYRSADDYIAAFTGLLQVTVRLNVKAIVGEAMKPLFSLSWKQRSPL